MLRSLVFGLTAAVIWLCYSLVARDQDENTATIYGVMLGFFGLGSISGVLLIGKVWEVLSNATRCRNGPALRRISQKIP